MFVALGIQEDPIWIKNCNRILGRGPKRAFTIKNDFKNPEKDLSKIESLIESGSVDDLRAIVCTQPKLINLKET